jgi:hypothetical protein
MRHGGSKARWVVRNMCILQVVRLTLMHILIYLCSCSGQASTPTCSISGWSFFIRPSTSPTIRENEEHIVDRFVRWERNGPDYVTHSERLLVRAARSPCHHTPCLCLSFSPHLRSSISNLCRYRHFSPDGQDSPLVTPKPYDRSYADYPARRPSSQASTAPRRPQFQLHIARAAPSRSPVESQCRNPSPLGRDFYCLPYRAPFVRFPFSFHHRPSALHSTVCLFYLSPEYRTLPRDHLSPYSCVAYLYIIPSPDRDEGV